MHLGGPRTGRAGAVGSVRLTADRRRRQVRPSVVGTAHPGHDGPACGTAVLELGAHLLTGPLGLPPGSAGTTSLDLAVG